MFLFIINILSYSGSDVIDNGPVLPALSEQPMTGKSQLNHSESEGCVLIDCPLLINCRLASPKSLVSVVYLWCRVKSTT